MNAPAINSTHEPGTAARIASQSDDATFATEFDLADLAAPPPDPATPAAAPTPGAAPRRAAPSASPPADDEATAGAPTEDEGAEASAEEEGEPTADTPAEGYYRDKNGRWHRPDHTFASAEEITEQDAERAEQDASQRLRAETPAAAAATPAPPADGKPADGKPAEGQPAPAPFSAKQGDDEVDLPDNLTFSFKANGKERTVTVQQLISTAQRGYFNAEREEQITKGRAEMQEFEQQRGRFVEQYREMETRLNQVLDDAAKMLQEEDYYFESRQRFLENNKPEARVKALEERLGQYERGELQPQQTGTPVDQAQAQHFVSALSAAVIALLEEFPEVTFEELNGKLSMETAPLLRGGQLPADRFNDVAKIVRGTLREFAAGRHEQRAVARQKREEEVEAAKEQVTKTKRTLQLQKRQLARSVAPSAGSRSGGTPGTRPTPKAPSPHETAAQSVERSIAEVFADLPH